MFLLTHGYYMNEDLKEQSIMKPYVPLGMLYVSAYLEQHAVEHQVFDSTFSTFDAHCQYLLTHPPKLIGIYTNLMTKLNVIRLIRFIRSKHTLQSCKIILGGPELRHNASGYLQAGADLLVIGEGEVTFYELCVHFNQSASLNTEVLGIAFLDEQKKVCFTAERPLIKNMDTIPMPARQRVDLNQYAETWQRFHGYRTLSISTMRGCPYTCKWCSRAVYGGTYRRRSAHLVVEEMLQLREHYAVDRIWFVDDVFTINHTWLRNFKKALEAVQLRIPYEVITRADRMNEEVITLLAQTGCYRVWIGAESGSQSIIDAMDRRVDVGKVAEMIIKTKAAGIEAGTFIMLGYPGETRSHIAETIRHLKKSDPSSFTITVAYPIAGTPLFEEVKSSLKSRHEWFAQTDRDYEFERGKNRSYYDYAVKWVYNEVYYSKTKKLFPRISYKSKSLLAQVCMTLLN